MLQIQVNEATAERRRVTFDLRDEFDGITPETGEVGGQPQRTFLGPSSKTVAGTLSPDITGFETYVIQETAVGGQPTYFDSSTVYYIWFHTGMAGGSGRWVISEDSGDIGGENWWTSVAGGVGGLNGDFASGSGGTAGGRVDVSGTLSPDIDVDVWVNENAGLFNGKLYYDSNRATPYVLWWDGSDTWFMSTTQGGATGGGDAWWSLTHADVDGGTYAAGGTATGTASVDPTSNQTTGTATVSDGPTDIQWTDAGIGVLVIIGNGRYYAELTADAVDTVGDAIYTRYKSAATAETPGESFRVVNFDPDAVAGAVDLSTLQAKLLAYIQLLARADEAIETDNATELTEINANGGSGPGDYKNDQDSLEGIYQRGNQAWLTGAGAGATESYTEDTAWVRTTGDNDGGAASDTLTVNGTTFSTGELSGGAFLQVDVEFTIVSGETANVLDVWGNYNGGSSHSIRVMALDTVSALYEDIGSMESEDDVSKHSFGFSPGHTDGTTVKVRFLHSSVAAGGPSHVLHIDKAQVNTITPATPAPSEASIADAVWDELETGHVSAGKAGKQLWTTLATAAEVATVGLIVNLVRQDTIAILLDTDELVTNQGGGTGTGARTVAVTVNDGAAVLENATVRFTEGANTYAGPTDASGEISFSLDDATYAVAVSKPGYTFTPTTLVVDGDKTPTYSMTAVSITAPPNAATTTGVMTVYDEEGSVEEGVTITVQVIDGPGTDGIGYDSTEWAELSSALGVVEFAGIILGARYKIWRGTSKPKAEEFTAPTTGTSFDLAEVIGRG